MKKLIITFIIGCIMVALCACGTQSLSDTYKGPDFDSLEATNEWSIKYSKQYSVTEYGEYSLINIGTSENNTKYLLVPENSDIPKNIPEDVTVLKQPLSNTYLVSSSAMDMICQIGALDNIKMTGTKLSDWHIEEPINAMNSGKIKYAGKYSEPDYEMILDNNCNLAIENTMIWHNPETKEKLEELGIPVIVELSSYEDHPLGRLEWIRLYGLLFDKKDIADDFFQKEINGLGEMTDYTSEPENDVTVAFFYITANGAVNVKKPSDYVPKMITMAGGKYAVTNINDEEENALSTINMQFEEFYAQAKNADIIIYNSTINDDIDSVDDLIKKNPLIADFEAVKNNRVYESGANFYQETTRICEMIRDLNILINNDDENNLHFISHLR